MGKERILFIDDDETLVVIWKELLEDLGYQVTETTSSLAALKLFRKEPGNFDLVITDCFMAEMPGMDLAREMKLIRDDIPIILCTSNRNIIDPEEAGAVGIQAIMTKPFSQNDIAEIIPMVLKIENGK